MNSKVTVLPEPREELWTLRELKNMVINKQMDLQPSYQRDVVWTSLKRSYLIDSLRNRFYVPPIVTALRETEPGVWKLNIVDGKQRMTAILDYFDNIHPSIPPRVAVTKENKLFYSKARRGGSVLSKKERQHFDNLKLIVVQYIGLTEFQERELFQRMQMGMTLTPSERMHAIESPMHDFLQDIIEQYPILNEVLTQARMKYTQDLAQVLNMIFYNHHSIPNGEPTVRFLNETHPTEEEKEKAIEVFAKFARFLNRYRSVMIDNEFRMSPVEFLFCCKLVQTNKAISGETFLNIYINTWHHVREIHPNQVKKNKDVMTTLQKYAYSKRSMEQTVHTHRAQEILSSSNSLKGGKRKSASSTSELSSSRKRNFDEISLGKEISSAPVTSLATDRPNTLLKNFPTAQKIPTGSIPATAIGSLANSIPLHNVHKTPRENKRLHIKKRFPTFNDDSESEERTTAKVAKPTGKTKINEHVDLQENPSSKVTTKSTGQRKTNEKNASSNKKHFPIFSDDSDSERQEDQRSTASARVAKTTGQKHVHPQENPSSTKFTAKSTKTKEKNVFNKVSAKQEEAKERVSSLSADINNNQSSNTSTKSTIRCNQIQEAQKKMQEELAAVERMLKGSYSPGLKA